MRTICKAFREYCLDLVGAEYVYGAEDVDGVDCSGTLRYALTGIYGQCPDETADGFRRRFFKPFEDGDSVEDNIVTVFYDSELPFEKLNGRTMPAGTTRHVAPVVGDFVVLHADYYRGVVLKTAKSVRLIYEGKDCVAHWMKLDEEAFEKWLKKSA